MFKNFKAFSKKQKILFLVIYGFIIAAAIFIFVFNSRRVLQEQTAVRETAAQHSVTEVAAEIYGGAPGKELHHAEIELKDYGTVVLELDATSAPATVKNFITLAESGFYDELNVYRVVDGFIAQFGDCTGTNAGAIDGEFSSNGYQGNTLSHIRGTVSLAHGDSPDSGSSEFFICLSDCYELDGDYAAFGWVTSGMEILDALNEDSANWGKDRYGAIIKTSDRPVITTIRVTD